MPVKTASSSLFITVALTLLSLAGNNSPRTDTYIYNVGSMALYVSKLPATDRSPGMDQTSDNPEKQLMIVSAKRRYTEMLWRLIQINWIGKDYRRTLCFEKVVAMPGSDNSEET